jgi:hypothetical protein
MACFLHALRAEKTVILQINTLYCVGLYRGNIYHLQASAKVRALIVAKRPTSVCKDVAHLLLYPNMATAAVHLAPGNTLGQVIEPLASENKPAKHDVHTELYYYDDPGDGTPPVPSYVG